MISKLMIRGAMVRSQSIQSAMVRRLNIMHIMIRGLMIQGATILTQTISHVDYLEVISSMTNDSGHNGSKGIN